MTPAKLKLLLIVFSVLIITGPILANWYALVRFDTPNIGPFSPLQIIRGILFIILLGLLYKYIPRSLKAMPVVKPMLALAIYLFILMPFHQTPVENSVYIFQMLYLCMFMVGGYSIGLFYKNADEWIFQISAITLVIVIFFQIYGYLKGYQAIYSEYALGGIGGRLSVTATSIATLFPIFILRIYRMKFSEWIVLSLAFISLTMTMRRGEILSVLIGFIGASFFIVKYQNKYGSKVLSHVVMVIIILVSIVYLIISTPLSEDFQKRLDDMVISEGGTGSGRINFWEAGLRSSVNRKNSEVLLGEGLGNIRKAIARHYHRPVAAHNVWIEVLISGGIIGVLILLVYYINLTYTIKRTLFLYRHAIISAVLIVVIYGIFQGEIFSPSFGPLYMLIGLSTGVYIKNRNLLYYESYHNQSIPQY
jgi:hypothetical protein